MERRRFLALMSASTAMFALDPERLLWVPGQKTIFIPSARPLSPPPVRALSAGQIVAAVWAEAKREDHATLPAEHFGWEAFDPKRTGPALLGLVMQERPLNVQMYGVAMAQAMKDRDWAGQPLVNAEDVLQWQWRGRPRRPSSNSLV